MGMKIRNILEEIKSLAKSQGSWGRLYEELMDIRDNAPEQWISLVEELEEENFGSTLDMVLYFEEGKSSRDISDDEYLELIIDQKVATYDRSDYSETVYIYNDLAYIGESGHDNMVRQIKEDYGIPGGSDDEN